MKITLTPELVKRIDALREELNKEMGFCYGREEVVALALTAFEDVRMG